LDTSVKLGSLNVQKLAFYGPKSEVKMDI